MELFETRWVTVSGTVYGPNGSQDSAVGYKEGAAFASMCGATVMVRAFDQVSDSWSNLLDVDADC